MTNRFTAYCGLNCETCEARIAAVTNDESLRQKVAREWSMLNHAVITPEMINCTGCRMEGAKTPFCDALCEIRQCGLEKGVMTCGQCRQMENCEKLAVITANHQEALENLRQSQENGPKAK